ncbi:hypothetical protein RCL1_001829 [Eukaryota sp. TZLM3-RCL]
MSRCAIPFTKSASPDFTTTWNNTLQPAIRAIFEKKAFLLSFSELYVSTYNLVVHGNGASLYNKLVSEMEFQCTSILNSLLQHTDTDFLEELSCSYADYERYSRLVCEIFMYLDSGYVRLPGQTLVDPIKSMCLNVFVAHLFPSSHVSTIQQRTTSLLLSNFQRARELQLPPSSVPFSVKSCVSMLMSLGLKSRAVYLHVFEGIFLEHCHAHYLHFATTHLYSVALSDYIDTLSTLLDYEFSLVSYLVDHDGAEAARLTAHDALVVKNLDSIFALESGPIMWVQSPLTYIKPLQQLYKLIVTVNDGQSRLINLIIESMRSELRSIKMSYASNLDSSFSAFVEALIQIYSRIFHDLIENCFENSTEFKRLAHNDFELTLNEDQDGLNSTMIAIALSRHTDFLLTVDLSSQSDIIANQLFDEIVAIFKLLRSKDVFECAYSKSLSKRLLGNRIISIDLERMFVSKFKVEVGQNVIPLESMLRDFELSNQIMIDFAQSESYTPLVSAHVLTFGRWPFSVDSFVPVIPLPLLDSFNSFSEFYLSKQTSRKLSLVYHKSTAEISFEIFDGFGGKSFLIACTLLQALVLTCFDRFRQILTLNQIEERTGIPYSDLIGVVEVLCRDPKRRLLLRKPQDKQDQSQWSRLDEFVVNEKFSSKTFKITLMSEGPTRKKEENAVLAKQIDHDRNHLIDASIVRLMKVSKRIGYSELIDRVKIDLRLHFQPSTQSIKSRVESLIERDFIEREGDSRDYFKYVA